MRFHLIQVLQHNNEVERMKNSVKHNAGKKLLAQSSESTGFFTSGPARAWVLAQMHSGKKAAQSVKHAHTVVSLRCRDYWRDET